MTSYTDVNKFNVENIRQQILFKESSTPYHVTVREAKGVSTDYDNFPYNRWYRGKFNSSQPIVAEREAGWREVENQCYRLNAPPCEKDDFYPKHCFQTPCSTVFPCYPSQQSKYSGRDALLVAINKACIPQYR